MTLSFAERLHETRLGLGRPIVSPQRLRRSGPDGHA